MITLKATLVTADDDLRAELEPLTDFKLIAACAQLESASALEHPDAAMRHVLGSLARRWLALHEEVEVHSRHLKVLTNAAAPQLVQAVSTGLDVAAEMLVTAGDNRDRIRSEAGFAKMCRTDKPTPLSTAPSPSACAGMTTSAHLTHARTFWAEP